MNKDHSIVLLVLVAVALSSISFGCVESESNIEKASRFSGLDIPDDAEIIDHSLQEAELNGDFTFQIAIQLTPEQMNEVADDWKSKGYSDEPGILSRDGNTSDEDLILKYLKPEDQWLLRVVAPKEEQTSTAIALNLSSNVMIVRHSLQ